MAEYHTLRALLGIMQVAIVWILWKGDIGYLLRFGLVMFASAAWNLAPAFPYSAAWQHYIQIPAYVVMFSLMATATLEFFGFLRRRTFIEERSALLLWASVMGLIPVWIFWWWPGDDFYQSFMLARQYGLMWMAGAYLAAWCWLRAIRPVHAELRISDHGEFWGAWLVSAALLSSTTKWGVLWRYSQWKDGDVIWRTASDIIVLVQICICAGFVFNLTSWKASGDAAQDVPVGPQDPARYQTRRLLHP